MQLSTIIVLLGLMLELVEFNESYKIKSYYNPHPWRRLRWHPLPKHRKHYHPKKRPIHKYRHYEPEPEYDRYAPYYEDTSDHDTKPYIIVIQLPNKNEKNKYYSYRRTDATDSPQNIDDNIDDNDYVDDSDELKVYQLNKKLK